MKRKSNGDGNQAVILWGIIVVGILFMLLWIAVAAKGIHPFIIAGGFIMPLTDTEERLARVTAQQAAEDVASRLLPYLVRIDNRQSWFVKVWAWFKAWLAHGAETASKIRIE